MTANTDEKPHPEIDALECKACGRCVVACPVKCLSLGCELNARGYTAVVYSGSGCVGCGNCYLTCPEPNCVSVVIPAKK